MSLFDKQAKNQEKKQLEYEKNLQAKSKQLLKWCEEDGWKVKDTVIVLSGCLQGLKQTMEAKTNPIIKENNAKTLKEFYAATSGT